MAILVNIEPAEEAYKPIKKGMEAAKNGANKYCSPYPPDTQDFDLWLLGYMAQTHGWDIEF